jgi:uncharacterized phage-associated protein
MITSMKRASLRTRMASIACPKINERIYKNAVLYFLKYCNNKFLHATKLNKLFYYFDFIHYRDHQVPATGDVYLHLDFGPVPTRIGEVLSKLKSDGVIDTEAASYKDGECIRFDLTKPSALDETVFTKDQKKLLKQICDEFGSWKTEAIVNQTHLEAPWFYSKPYEVVDYEYSKDIDFFRT